ncbi:hypothetical protein [Aureispira anguillae]|uniref:Uncharacterized protein n=1 Tax=Aureispira anguillae TaxID=2864201 RepID=A0A915VJX6_9BACT|nr:hypothetical protein [Aureispira anguillae]BDS09356.1 hypothetical protein AsAng_0000540 [Aureispira anguillae]
MAFKITLKLKAEQIKNRSIDVSFLDKYYKGLQQLLIQNTNVETTTDYFFCENFMDGKDLLVMGDQTEGHKKVFKAAGKGNEGFDKSKISMGSCFILEEKDKKILCIQANNSLAKGKKAPILKALKKMQRSFMKQIHEVRWLNAPLMVDAQDPSKVESATPAAAAAAAAESANDTTTAQAPQISTDEVVKKAKDIKRGLEKLVNDVIPRYKKRHATANDAAFVNALRKAGLIFLTNLTQTDAATSKKFASQKKILEKGIPKWKKLETAIHSQKTRNETSAAIKQSLHKVVKRMNETRSEIKEILKRVDLKTLG